MDFKISDLFGPAVDTTTPLESNTITNFLNTPAIKTAAAQSIPQTEKSDDSEITDKQSLSAPKGTFTVSLLSDGLAGAASFAAVIMALIQQSTSELVRDNRNISYQAGMDSAESLEQQADTIRDTALAKLITDCISGTMEIAGGLVQSIGMSPKFTSGLGDAQLQARGEQFSGISKFLSGLGSLSKAAGSFIESSGQAKLKEQEADQQRIETLRDQIKSITDSLAQTVEQTISTMDTVLQGEAETNKKILA